MLVGLLDQKGDTAILAGNNADSLFQVVNTVFRCCAIAFSHRSSWWAYLVGDLTLVLRTVSPMASKIDITMHTLRLYRFLRLRGSREN